MALHLGWLLKLGSRQATESPPPPPAKLAVTEKVTLGHAEHSVDARLVPSAEAYLPAGQSEHVSMLVARYAPLAVPSEERRASARAATSRSGASQSAALVAAAASSSAAARKIVVAL